MGATVAVGVGAAVAGVASAGASMYSSSKASSAAGSASTAEQNYASMAGNDLAYAGTRANQYALDTYNPQMDRYGQQQQLYENMQGTLAQNTGMWDQQLQRQQDATSGYTDLYNRNVDQLGQWDQQLQRSMPYYQAGVNALQQEQTPFSFSQTDPSYQWRLQQGQKALQTSAAAKGNALSGGTMKAMDQYSQGLASTEYQNEFQRYLSQNQIYQNIANQGLTAQGQMGNALSGASGTLGQMGNNQNSYVNLINSMGNTLQGRGVSLGQQQNNLSGMQGNINAMGQSGENLAALLSQNTMTGAGAQASSYNTQGNALANQYYNQSNALTGGIQSGTNNLMSAYNMYNQGQYQNAITNYLNQSGGGGYNSGNSAYGINNITDLWGSGASNFTSNN